jgi:preprotein translocase subunit SecG
LWTLCARRCEAYRGKARRGLIMSVIKVILIIIEVMTSILLVGVILLQKSKDEGLGLAFGAGVGETLFGSRAGNVLTKITIGLAVVFLVNTLLIGMVLRNSVTSGSVTDRLPPEQVAPPQPASSGEGTAMPESPAPIQESAPAAAPAVPASAETPAPVVPAPAAP